MRFPVLFFVAGGATAFLVLPAIAQAADAEPQESKATQNTPADDPDRIVCKSEPIIGSRMRSRVCASLHEWDQRRHDDQIWLNDFTERSLQICTGGNASGC